MKNGAIFAYFFNSGNFLPVKGFSLDFDHFLRKTS